MFQEVRIVVRVYDVAEKPTTGVTNVTMVCIRPVSSRFTSIRLIRGEILHTVVHNIIQHVHDPICDVMPRTWIHLKYLLKHCQQNKEMARHGKIHA